MFCGVEQALTRTAGIDWEKFSNALNQQLGLPLGSNLRQKTLNAGCYSRSAVGADFGGECSHTEEASERGEGENITAVILSSEADNGPLFPRKDEEPYLSV
jgi:hypothetical protein